MSSRQGEEARYYEDPQLQARILPPPASLPNINEQAGGPRREHGKRDGTRYFLGRKSSV